jgi:hypothetical protein
LTPAARALDAIARGTATFFFATSATIAAAARDHFTTAMSSSLPTLERRLRTRSEDRYMHGMLLAEGRDRQSKLEERIAVLGRYL